mgnify:FL=1
MPNERSTRTARLIQESIASRAPRGMAREQVKTRRAARARKAEHGLNAQPYMRIGIAAQVLFAKTREQSKNAWQSAEGSQGAVPKQ